MHVRYRAAHTRFRAFLLAWSAQRHDLGARGTSIFSADLHSPCISPWGSVCCSCVALAVPVVCEPWLEVLFSPVYSTGQGRIPASALRPISLANLPWLSAQGELAARLPSAEG
eukprot:scaffold17242_cov126-Isochrysis_galbana.AAC.7